MPRVSVVSGVIRCLRPLPWQLIESGQFRSKKVIRILKNNGVAGGGDDAAHRAVQAMPPWKASSPCPVLHPPVESGQFSRQFRLGQIGSGPLLLTVGIGQLTLCRH